jgi:hypothetical protein
MNKLVIAAALCGTLALSGCGGTAVPPSNLELCGAALFAAGSSSPMVLLKTALSTPACVALGMEELQKLIGNVSMQQRARGVRG